MNNLNLYLRNRLRDADGTQGGDDSTDGEQEKPKTFTQEEVDELIKKRIAREKKKLEKPQEKIDKVEEKPAATEPAKDDSKINELQIKVLCFEHEIAKEYSKKAIALAQAYLDDETDIDEALEKVVEDFPQFKKGYSEDDQKQKSWGERQTKPPAQQGGVEEAFKRKNPDLKF